MSGSAAATRKGLLTILLTAALSLGLTALSDGLGWRWVEPVIWPTDLLSFSQLELEEPPELVILGSSRASMGFVPGLIEGCLREADPAAGEVFNLGRAYASLPELEALARGILVEDKRPKRLLLALDFEAIDANNPRAAGSMHGRWGLDQLGFAAGRIDSGAALVDWLRAPTRGPAALIAAAADRHEQDPRLGWIMREHGGGQWCAGTADCEAQNLDFKRAIADRWERVEKLVLPRLRAEQAPDWAPGAGRVGVAWAGLRAWSTENNVELLVVQMPVSAEWAAATPPDIAQGYAQWLDENVVAHNIPLWRDEGGRAGKTRRSWADPDHLNDSGAASLSKRVCRELLLRPAAGGR